MSSNVYPSFSIIGEVVADPVFLVYLDLEDFTVYGCNDIITEIGTLVNETIEYLYMRHTGLSKRDTIGACYRLEPTLIIEDVQSKEAIKVNYRPLH